MRLVGAFNPILEIAAFGWQQLRYGVDAVRNPHTEMWYVIDRLSDFEFVAAHNVLDDNRMESRGKSPDMRISYAALKCGDAWAATAAPSPALGGAPGAPPAVRPRRRWL
jgi:hypothetical protein